MDLGFKQAGYNLIWANELWKDAATTYRLNLGEHIVHSPIGQVDTDDIPNGDVVIGGFPCQGFSVANRNRHASDERNALYLEYLRVLTAKQPKFFFAENVKGLISLAGLRRTFHFPPPITHGPPKEVYLRSLKSWVTIGDCLSGIPEPNETHSLANHECTTYKLRFNGHQGHRTIHSERPSPTITARGDERGGVVIHHHPRNHRRLSARETAIIQSFPVEYVFYGSKTSVYRQVANAVPPLLARRVAEWLRDCIANGVPA